MNIISARSHSVVTESGRILYPLTAVLCYAVPVDLLLFSCLDLGDKRIGGDISNKFIWVARLGTALCVFDYFYIYISVNKYFSMFRLNKTISFITHIS